MYWWRLKLIELKFFVSGSLLGIVAALICAWSELQTHFSRPRPSQQAAALLNHESTCDGAVLALLEHRQLLSDYTNTHGSKQLPRRECKVQMHFVPCNAGP